MSDQPNLVRRCKIVVVGSSNTDMVARAPRHPAPGETILGESFEISAGGKGANQAVAAARLGADVTLIARLGVDDLGDRALAGLTAEGIDTTRIVRDSASSSGIALITVDTGSGDNSIVVVAGANARLSPADVEAARDVIAVADMLVCQLESPLETTYCALNIAREYGVRTILNPAPAQALSDKVLNLVSVLTPNESEAGELIADRSASPADCARVLRSRGARSVIVTLGADGALIVDSQGERRIPGRTVSTVVDTTGAGDCFTGALAVALSEGQTLDHGVSFATAAASLSVTRAGAQQSLPLRREVDSL